MKMPFLKIIIEVLDVDFQKNNSLIYLEWESEIFRVE
jgi:hypothetical protein